MAGPPILTGAIGWIGSARKNVPIRAGSVAIALIVALALFGYLLSQFVRATGVPPIHEISTDLADPPAFVKIRYSPDRRRIPEATIPIVIHLQNGGCRW